MMILESLTQHPEIINQLRRKRMLITTSGHFSGELKASHEAKDHHSLAKPGRGASQIASKPVEIALKVLKDCSTLWNPPDNS